MDYWNIVWMDFKKGDDSAFEKIYSKNIDILFRYGSKITPDRDIVKDCIQQLFLELFSSRENLSVPENIEFYLLKSLKRIIIHRLEKDQKFNGFSEFEVPVFTIEFDFDEMAIAEKQQSETELLNEALQSLSPEKKELLFLKFYSGLNNRQIGSMLGIKPETVQKQLIRVLKRLQVKFVDRFLELFFLCFKA